MAIRIINNRIEGTRITVWDVYLYQLNQSPRDAICTYLSISADELAAAEEFIAANSEYVEQVHRQIEERNRQGNSPEVEAKLVKTRERMREWLAARRSTQSVEANGAGNPPWMLM